MKKILMGLVVTLALFSMAVASAETYVFERAWGERAFNSPKGVAVDSLGNIYVADTGNHRIQKIGPSSTTNWGSRGFGDGQFNNPAGIAVDLAGNIYVADTGNHRIQKLDSRGNFLGQWGHRIFSDRLWVPVSGSGDREFNRPEGIAIDSLGNIYVADTGNHRIQKLDSGGSFVWWRGAGISYRDRPRVPVSGSGDGEFNRPEGIAIDSLGNIYVADTGNLRLQKLSLDGTPVDGWGGEWSSSVAGVAIDSHDNVYATILSGHCVRKFDSKGIPLGEWGEMGTRDGEFQFPSGIAIDSSENFYVADTENDRIQKFMPVLEDINTTTTTTTTTRPLYEQMRAPSITTTTMRMMLKAIPTTTTTTTRGIYRPTTITTMPYRK